MRRAIAIAGGLVLGACGLDLAGTGADSADATDAGADVGAADVSARRDGASNADGGGTADATPPDSALDAPPADAPPADATPPVDALAPLAPQLYAVAQDFIVLAFAGQQTTYASRTPLPVPPPSGCPALGDVAVDDRGVVYGTSDDRSKLFVVDPASVKCTTVGTAGNYPAAMAFAPAGVFGNAPALVGYRPNGDYVRVASDTGVVTVVSAGALQSGITPGDIINFGSDGIVSLLSSNDNRCKNNYCLFNFDFSSGALGAYIGASVDDKPITGLAHWGRYVFAFASPDEVHVIDYASLQHTFLPSAGAPGPTYTGAGSSVAAPTQ